MPTALIIEDLEEICQIYQATLELLNFDVEIALNGQIALDRLEHSVPDLIILDLMLPKVSGHYIYKRIRTDPRFDKSIVIIISANLTLATALGSEMIAQDRVLMKPTGPDDLAKLVNSLGIQS